MNPNAFNQQFSPTHMSQQGINPAAMHQQPMQSQPGINPQMLASASPFPQQISQMPHQMPAQMLAQGGGMMRPPGQPMMLNFQQQQHQQQQQLLLSNALNSMGMTVDQFNSLPQQKKAQIYTNAFQNARQTPQSTNYSQMNNFDPHSANFMNHDRQQPMMAPARPGTPGMSNQQLPGSPMVQPQRPGTATGQRPPMPGQAPMNIPGMPRQPTAMPISNSPTVPSTSMGMNMGGMNGMGAPNMAMNGMPMMRPPSRPSPAMNMANPSVGMNMDYSGQNHAMNGGARPGSQASPTHPQAFPNLASPTPAPIPNHTPSDHGSPARSATPSSPYRNGKRKLPGDPPKQSPRAPSTALPLMQPVSGHAPLTGASPVSMGPPNITRSSSTSSDPSFATRRQTQSPRPPSSHGIQMPPQNSPSPSFLPHSGDALNGMHGPSSLPSQAPNTVASPLPNTTTPAAEYVEPAESRVATSQEGVATASSVASGDGAPSSAVPQSTIPQLPPLPKDVNLDASVTRIEVVPLAGSDKTIPPLADHEVSNVMSWMKTDKEYTTLYKQQRESLRASARETLNAPRWWERGGDPLFGTADNRLRRDHGFNVHYPDQRIPNSRTSKRKGFKLPRTVDPALAERPEQLVPIRLEFDVDQHKMRDTFLWNINDPVISAEDFARSIVDDYALPSQYHNVITKSIQEQLSDFQAHSLEPSKDGPEPPVALQGVLNEKDRAWWEGWRGKISNPAAFPKRGPPRPPGRKARKRQKLVLDETEDKGHLGDVEEDRVLTLDEISFDDDESKEDMRILVKLDVIVGRLKLDDQFEWDLDNPSASPEGFAEVYCQELGLAGEFKTAIAHSIREQVFAYRKSLFLVGHPAEGGIQDEDLRSSLLPALSSGSRALDQVASFTPILSYMSDGDLDRSEKDREKDINKRRKRNTRARRGVALPDREPIRTFRTPANGFPEIDPATVTTTSATPGRRAAATAATQNIATMIASENTDIMDSPTNTPKLLPAVLPTVAAPAPVVPPPKKEKSKSKGLMEAPKIPAPLLRSRATVAAPTPSTAVDIKSLPRPLEDDPPPSPPPVAPNRPPRVVSAKRAKELAREAKEKEFVEGQHPNYWDGVWHCSNCGCPETIAVGRRKGPLGDQSQCGPCGKFWHGHKRPKPVEYSRSEEFHLNQKSQTQTPAKRSRKKAPTRESQLDISETLSTNGKSRVDSDDGGTPGPSGMQDDDRAISPVSSVSSTSEKPLAQRARMNGSHPPDSFRPSSESGPGTNSGNTQFPGWLQTAIEELRQKYPHDLFEVIPKNPGNLASSEWRLKCLDCPGKLYMSGPGETLSNYEVHLKNRLHRKAVGDRVDRSQAI